MSVSINSPQLYHKVARIFGYWLRGFKGVDRILRMIHHPNKRKKKYIKTIVQGIPAGPFYNIETRWFTEWTTYFYGSQDKNIHNWIIKNCKKNWVSMDIGMNYGYFTCLLAKFTHSVHGFEPIDWIFKRAQENIKLNCYKNAYLYNLALSHKLGSVLINLPSLDDCNWGTSSIVHSSTSNNSILIPTQTLDEFIKIQNIKRLDFIKLDVEGAENLVLMGAKESLVRFNPIIIFEKNNESFSETFQFLFSLGYRFETLNGIQISSCNDSLMKLPDDILAIHQSRL